MDQSIFFDRDPHHAAGEWSKRIDPALPIGIKGRARAVTKSFGSLFLGRIGPLVQSGVVCQNGKFCLDGMNVAMGSDLYRAAGLRGEGGQGVLQLMAVKNGNRKWDDATTKTPLSAGESFEEGGSGTTEPTICQRR